MHFQIPIDVSRKCKCSTLQDFPTLVWNLLSDPFKICCTMLNSSSLASPLPQLSCCFSGTSLPLLLIMLQVSYQKSMVSVSITSPQPLVIYLPSISNNLIFMIACDAQNRRLFIQWDNTSFYYFPFRELLRTSYHSYTTLVIFASCSLIW